MRGFTLFECLTYIALFSILITGAFTGEEAFTESADRNATSSLLDDEGSYLIGKIQNEINAGTSLSVSISDSRLMQTDNSLALPLSDSLISVEAESIDEHDTINPTRRSIAISLRLSAATSAGQILTRDYSGTSYLWP